MPYKALTYVALGDVIKAPGDKITDKELSDAGQEDDDIDRLMEDEAISDDMDAEVHPDHQVTEAEAVIGNVNVSADDSGEGGEE